MSARREQMMYREIQIMKHTKERKQYCASKSLLIIHSHSFGDPPPRFC